MRYPGFVGPSSKLSSYMADNEETINFYIETGPQGPWLAPTPGFAALGSVPEGPGRGSCIAGTSTFFVAGSALYERDAANIVTQRGTLTTDGHPATLCWNGPAGGQLFITSGDMGYCYVIATATLTVVLASGATMGAYLDGFFLALDAATGTLQISDLLDGLTWDASQIAQRSDAADPWVAMTVIHAEIWLLGSRTSAVWFNAGSFPFPFEAIPGARPEKGIAAPFSTPRDIAPLVWVSANAQGDRQVLMADGYDGRRISDYAIEAAMQHYAVIDDAVSMNFQLGGHTFCGLIFPTADASWLYDFGENRWTKWRYWNTLTSTWEAVRVRTHVFTPAGEHFVQDRSSGAFYRMGLDLFTDVDGALILRERTPPIWRAPDRVRFIVDRIELIMDVGVGTLGGSTTDPSVRPKAMLQTSRDGGQTWGPERTANIGAVGAYQTRPYFTNVGQARDRQDRFRFAFNAPARVVDALAWPRMGTS